MLSWKYMKGNTKKEGGSVGAKPPVSFDGRIEAALYQK